MLPPLNGAVCLITGASSGIGQATAQKLAAEGASVTLVGRREDRLATLASRIHGDGGRAHVMAADITSAAAAAAVVEASVAEYGRLDILVNAAGIMLNGDSLTSTLDEWDQMVDVNLKGLMYATKAALPHLIDAAETGTRQVADVVNISSISGRIANARVAIYNATKFGVSAATESWRQEFSSKNVRFSVIEPGVVDTELFDHQQESMQKHYQQLFGHVEKLHPEDIADTISFVVTNPRRIAINEVVIRPTDHV